MTLSPLQLRCLLANDLRRIEHYSGLIVGEDGVIDALPHDDPERATVVNKLGDTIRRAQRRRAALESLSPAAPRSVSACVVTCAPAAQPGSPL